MSFIDMAFLRKKDLQNGILSYRRQKTGQQLFIKWEKPMQEIIDRYDTQGSPYLLPIIRDMEVDGRKQYKKTAHLVNQKLKKLGMPGLALPRVKIFPCLLSVKLWDTTRRTLPAFISPHWILLW